MVGGWSGKIEIKAALIPAKLKLGLSLAIAEYEETYNGNFDQLIQVLQIITKNMEKRESIKSEMSFPCDLTLRNTSSFYICSKIIS